MKSLSVEAENVGVNLTLTFISGQEKDIVLSAASNLYLIIFTLDTFTLFYLN